LTVDAAIPSTLDLLGLNVEDLQENIEISDDNVISGTLKYVTDYTGFSGNVAEQQGNYLALHFDVPDVDGVTLTVNGTTLDTDGVIVLIVDDTTKKVRATASKAGYPDVTKTYALTGLTLNEA
jgi:hypothetical protein